MIQIEKTEVVGWEHAIRGMRNPMNSWDRSDSFWCEGLPYGDCKNESDCVNKDKCCNGFRIGQHDLALMQKLAKAGTDHRKFMRMIVVYCDITAPLYWWKEFDTYKVGTVANSCSTMHKLCDREFTMDDFSVEHLVSDCTLLMDDIIHALNNIRDIYLDFDHLRDQVDLIPELTCKNDVWWQMIQLLPTSYNQKRTVMMNYEVLSNIYNARKNHKLDEWRELCKWIEALPYSCLMTGKDGEPDG